MFKKFLVSIDGSPHAQKGLEAMADFAQNRSELEIHLVHVVDSLLLTRMGDLSQYASKGVVETDVQDILQKEAEDLLAQAAKYLEQNTPTAKVITHLEFGYPSRHICECADKNEVDLIILGSRGLRGVERILMGSVATEVANHTSRNIMIVK